MNRRADVFVVGGGPAGLVAAIAACRQGLSVIVADGADHPIDKPCGEGLIPETQWRSRSSTSTFRSQRDSVFAASGFSMADNQVCAEYPAGTGDRHPSNGIA